MILVHTVLRGAACAALLFGFAALAVERDPASLALTEQIVQAHGGAPAIERVVALDAQGHIKSAMRGEVGVYRRWFNRPRLLRVETTYPRSGETRIFNGTQAWRSGPGGQMQEVDGISRLAMIYQAKQLDLLHTLVNARFNLRHLGPEALGERRTEAMEVWDDEGPVMRVNVDAATHRIVKVAAQFAAQGKTTSLAVEFSDYRPVDGLLLPFRLNNFAGGLAISETLIAHYTLNPPAEPGLFQPSPKEQGLALAGVAPMAGEVSSGLHNNPAILPTREASRAKL